VVNLVEVMHYHPEGRGLDPVSDRNEYQGYLLGLKGGLILLEPKGPVQVWIGLTLPYPEQMNNPLYNQLKYEV